MDLFQDEFDGELTYDGGLAEWVMGKCNEWREHYDANYAAKHEEYYRLFRNQWSSSDKTRQSERSQLIAPALAQAVESNVAEVEEATFGRGKIFDIRPNLQTQQVEMVVAVREALHQEFALNAIRSRVAEVLLNAAIYGTGIAEVVIEEKKVQKPAQRPALDGAVMQYGIESTVRVAVGLNPLQPKNLLIDPACTNVNDALGCAVDEFVSRHIVEELQEQGVYRDEYVGDAAADEEIEPDKEIDSVPKGRVRRTKYYGKVPRALLIAEGVDEEDIKETGYYVEAIVVIANEGVCLKAVPNPYMCQDRPILAFQWDIVPSRFWGRGVCEKGYMSQKALDAELRARIDALALTTHPMLAVDATRIPRGTNLEVKPGRMLLTNGSPQDSIMPFNFGSLNQVTFAQGAQLQQMVSQATGAGDMSQPTVQNDVTAAGMSMGQGAIIKRQKRTLLNFQENFLIPFVKKAALRYMQFDPERFPAADYEFVPFSSLGAMAREYEVGQLSQMLQVIPPDSPAHGVLIKGIIDHLNVSNREELISAIDAASQPDPAAQQAAQEQQQLQNAILQGQVQLLQAQSAESSSRATKYNTEADLYPQELVLKYADSDNDGQMDADFDKRIRLADLMLREKELEEKRQERNSRAEAQLAKELQAQAQPPVNPMA
jgi:hypothetical protein